VFNAEALPEFTAGLDNLSDATIRGVVVARIKRIERGLLSDVEGAAARQCAALRHGQA
jgi:putative component of toxin-antitoxin plasmid stabilization module